MIIIDDLARTAARAIRRIFYYHRCTQYVVRIRFHCVEPPVRPQSKIEQQIGYLAGRRRVNKYAALHAVRLQTDNCERGRTRRCPKTINEQPRRLANNDLCLHKIV